MQTRGQARTANPNAPQGRDAEKSERTQETEKHARASGAAQSWLDIPVLAALPLNWETAIYLLLFAVAVAMRFWDLGGRALHHDESLHATYSWYLYSGRGYVHDPMMHGPVQFHVNALMFFLFGVSDYTFRIQYALVGSLLVALPYFFRSRLGRTGALVVAAMLAFSPSFLYYSRFGRGDILIALWNLGLVVSLWRYISEKRPLFLYTGAASLAMGFAIKEVTWIHAVLFSAFLFAATWREWLQAVRSGLNLSRLSPAATFLLLIATLSLPQFAAGADLVQRLLNLNVSAPVIKLSAGLAITTGNLLAAFVVLGLIGATAALGMRWNRQLWPRYALIFYGIYVLFYTTFFTNPPGFASGIWGSLDYWLAQQGVQRGSQPRQYYFVLVPIYEFLPLIFAMAATAYYLLRRTLFTSFLIFWWFGAIVAYSIAGEKMPWLILHIALPMILLAGKLIGEWVDRIDWQQVARRGAAWLVPLLPLAVWALIAVLRTARSPQGPMANLVPLLGLLVALGVCVGLAAQIVGRAGRKQALHMAGLAFLLVLAGFTVRAAWMASYKNGDTPVEMLVYTQTSPDIPKIMADIDDIARRTGEGKNLKVTVDATESFTWPWAWYLRDYKNVDYPTLGSMSSPPLGSVLLLHSSNVDRAKAFLGKYGPGQKFRLRWWFPEDYKAANDWVKAMLPDDKKASITPTTPVSFGDVVGATLSPTGLGKLWNYWMYRIPVSAKSEKEPLSALGSSDGVVYYPKDASPMAAAPARPVVPDEVAAKQINVPSVLAFGTKGNGEGQLNEPKAIAVDREGNVYVMDSLNQRVEKFDRNGKFLLQFGSQGAGEGQFAGSFGGPWGLAVDASGNVFVVDTWNHRIEKFDPTGKFLLAWGGGLTDNRGAVEGNEGKFYGPRGIALDADGNVYVTDTGNHRVQKFDNNGKFGGAFGGRGATDGQLNEPVGIGLDAQGNIYVADTWNRRVVKFDRTFKFVSQTTVFGWEGEGLTNKPGLAVEPSGNVIVSDPDAGRLFRFGPTGALLAVIGRPGTDNASFNQPMGVAADTTGSIYVVEAGNNRVQKFQLPR